MSKQVLLFSFLGLVCLSLPGLTRSTGERGSCPLALFQAAGNPGIRRTAGSSSLTLQQKTPIFLPPLLAPGPCGSSNHERPRLLTSEGDTESWRRATRHQKPLKCCLAHLLRMRESDRAGRFQVKSKCSLVICDQCGSPRKLLLSHFSTLHSAYVSSGGKGFTRISA